MKPIYSLIVLALTLTLGGFVHARPAPVSETSAPSIPSLHGWIAKRSDNICGISDLNKVTNPAKVDYDHLMDETPQIKEMKRKGIDPDSTEGKALRKGARTLITKTSELVRKARGHCSVWKVIAHKSGRAIPDVTEHVAERF